MDIKKRIRFFLSSAFRQKNKFKYFKNDNKKIIQNGTLFLVNKIKIGCVVLDDIDGEDKIANLWYLIGDEKYLKKI